MSLELYLVRHAIAEERDPLRWPDDRLRPLTAKGIRRFEAAARGLRRLVPSVEALLTSPLVRARQTAEILVAEADWPEPQVLEALAPETPPSETIAALAALYSLRRIAAVGHEPHLSELAAALLVGEGAAPFLAFRKGGVACIAFDDGAHARGGTLRWLLTPKMLRLLARS
ncbi:MAG: phosphohistidine phosphatase SixA [Chloroflexota bacterium]|nr:phosphohistidine phosphatase SixA [Dehalococcoidia bacterium]MDW8253554.1 phosphohistidine phosphatase SixA [Chloroflexota bacterium]